MHNWPTKKLGEVAYFQEGPGLRTFQFKPSGIRVINVANVQDGFLDLTETKYLDPKEIKEKYQHFLVNEGDILLSTSGTIGRVARVRKENLPLMLNTSVMRLRSLNENTLLNQFLFYFLNSENFKRTLLSYKTGVAIFNVGPSHLKRIWLTLPPLPTQHQIVERLDAIKKAQELNDKQIALAEELFQSLLYGELKPKKDWQIKRIKEVVKEITYGISISVVSNLDSLHGILIVTMADITDDGQIDFSKVRKVKLNTSDISKFKLEDGDVLFNWRNASKELIGKTAIFENNAKAVYASFLLKIKCEPLLDNYYIYYYLNHLRKIGFFRDKCKFSANNTINASELKQLKIPLPPLETQRQIVEKLQVVQDYKKKLLEQKQKLKELFNSCLDKAMRGELVN